MLASRIVRLVATVLWLSVVSACSCGDSKSKLPDHAIKTGFVVGEHSFAFQNYGGAEPGADLQPEGLARMFGPEEVCATVRPDGSCRLTKVAKAWLEQINESMKGGRCEGFSVLSALMYLGKVNVGQFEGAKPHDIQFDGPIKQEIAYWFTTQYLAVARDSTKALSGVEAVEFLAAEYEKPVEAMDLWRVGMVRVDEAGRTVGGHAVTAILVAPIEGQKDKYEIRVYDNNHPADANRFIRVDSKAGTWEYRASTNPDEPDGLYQGTPANGNKLYLSPVRPRDGKQPCRFCKSGDIDQNAPLSQVFGSAPADVAVSDGAGHQLGVVGGKVVNTMPGASVSPAFSEDGLWGDDTAPVFIVPSKDALTYTITGKSGETGTASLAVVSAGSAVVVKNIALPGGAIDKLSVNTNGSITYEPSAGSAPTLTLTRTAADGSELQLTIDLPPDVKSVSLEVDAESGDVVVKATSRSGDPVVAHVEITRSSSAGEETLETELELPSGGTATFDTKDWEGEGKPIKVEIDKDSDGTVDETRSLEDTGPVGAPPAAPANVVATLAAGPKVTLTWTDTSNNEAGFEIQRGVDGGAFTALTSVGANVAAAADTTVAAEHDYVYRVRAQNPSGASAWVEAPVSLPAAAPTNLVATNVTTKQVVLEWTDNATRETGYRIERSLDVTPPVFAEVVTVAADAETHTDTTVAPGTAYVYRVTSVGPGGGTSATVQVQTPPRPSAPTTLAALAQGPTTVQLTWSSTPLGLTAIALERATDAGPFAPLISLAGDANTHLDQSVSSETSYRYRVRAVNAVGESDWSNEVTLTTPPPAPTNLVVASANATTVTLTWTDNASAETGYRVDRSTDGVQFSALSPLAANAATFTDSTATPDTSYVYRVVAIGPGGETGAQVAFQTPPVPKRPTNLTAIAEGPRAVTLSWTDEADNETGFEIERSEATGVFAQIATLSQDAEGFTDEPVDPDAHYTYRVRAKNADGVSEWSAEVDLTTPPLRPEGLQALALSASSVQLSWSDPGVIAHDYVVERAIDGPTPTFTTIATGKGDLTYTDSQAINGVVLLYRVTFVGEGGNASAEVSVQVPAAAPKSLTAVGEAPGLVRLTWSDETNDETTFEIERAPAGGSFAPLATLGPASTTFGDDGVDPETGYEYRVRATHAFGASNWSNVASITTPPPAVSGLSGFASVGDTTVRLSWRDIANTETGYRIERAEGSPSNFELVTVTPPGTSGSADAGYDSYQDPGRTFGITYYYRITTLAPSGETSTVTSVAVRECWDNMANCDGTWGCETWTNSDPNHCGGCNIKCTEPNGEITCSNSQCVVMGCMPGYAIEGNRCVPRPLELIAGDGQSVPFNSSDGTIAPDAVPPTAPDARAVTTGYVSGVTVAADGTVYALATAHNYGYVFKVNPDGSFERIIDPSAAPLQTAGSGLVLAPDVGGDLLLSATYNHRVKRLSGSTLTDFAGGGSSADGGLATTASLAFPQQVALDSLGNVFIANTNLQNIIKVLPDHTFVTVAGGSVFSGTVCDYSTTNCGDAGPATAAGFNYPSGVAVDAFGNIYIADTFNHLIRRVDAPSGLISKWAGTGTAGFGGDEGDRLLASFKQPRALLFDGAGNLFVVDSGNIRIRKIATDGTVTTVVSQSDGLVAPVGLAFDDIWRLYIASGGANRLVRTAVPKGAPGTPL